MKLHTQTQRKVVKRFCSFHIVAHHWGCGSDVSGCEPRRWRWWWCCWRASCWPDPWSCLWFLWQRSYLSSGPLSTEIFNRKTPLWFVYLRHFSLNKCSIWCPLITNSCTVGHESFSIPKKNHLAQRMHFIFLAAAAAVLNSLTFQTLSFLVVPCWCSYLQIVAPFPFYNSRLLVNVNVMYWKWVEIITWLYQLMTAALQN